MKNFNFIYATYLDDTPAIESLLGSDQQLNVNAGYGNSSHYKPIHLAAEFGKKINLVNL